MWHKLWNLRELISVLLCTHFISKKKLFSLKLREIIYFSLILFTIHWLRNHCEWWKATRTHFYGLYCQPYHEKEISWFPRGPCFCHSNLSFQKLQSTVGVRMRRVNTILLQTWRMAVVASFLSFIFHKFCLTKKSATNGKQHLWQYS